MGIFGNDQEQNERIDAIEEWLQGLTNVVHEHQLKTASLQLEVLKLHAAVNEKLSEQDFDPMIMTLSDKIGEARAAARQAAEAAGESWAGIQRDAMSALEELNEELEEAVERLDRD